MRTTMISCLAATGLLLVSCGDDDDDDAEMTSESESESVSDPVDDESDDEADGASATDIDDESTATATDIDDEPTATAQETVRPAAVVEPGMSWHWQLQGDLDTSVDADVYDIDLFDNDASTIAGLHADGRIVVCYFSTAWEDWRADADAWPDAVLGEPLDDWEGERWADIRSDEVRSLLAARLDLAAAKGCDGVEPDNVTAANNDTGFDLSPDDQLDFNRFLADAAGERGLLVGLKNDLEQIPALVEHFDFAVNEQCVQYDECDVYAPFADAGKAVFGAEYADDIVDDPTEACAIAAEQGISLIVSNYDLDGSLRITCD